MKLSFMNITAKLYLGKTPCVIWLRAERLKRNMGIKFLYTIVVPLQKQNLLLFERAMMIENCRKE